MQPRLILAVVLFALVPSSSAPAQAPWQNPYYGTAPLFKGLAVGDADGDGQADLFVNSLFAQAVRVLPGHADGTFNGAYLPIASGVKSFVVADFNTDGLDDVALINTPVGNVVVRLALGGSAYGGPLAVPSSAPATSLAAADVNGDGHLDLAVGLLNGSHVALALGAGDGSFVAAPDAVVPSLHESLRTGDVNGDGLADLITWGQPPFGSTLAVAINLGAASFQAPVTVFTGVVEDVDIGDVNGDGADDLALLHTTGKIIYGQLGGLPGPTEETNLYASGSTTIRIADLDDDGRPDLIVSGGLVNVSLQLPGGGFVPKISSGAYGSAALAIADVDHDGRLDLLAAAANGDLITVLIGQGDGGFRPSYGDDDSAALLDVVPADLDGDGRLDFVNMKSGETGVDIPLQPVRQGEFDASFAPPTGVSTGIRPSRLAVADVTGDGVPDLLALGQGASPDPISRISITPGNGDLSFGTPVISPVVSAGAVGDFVDFDADGLLDAILVGKTGGGQHRLSMMIDQGGSFALDSTLVFTLGAHSVQQLVAADLNQDGVTDVALRCSSPTIVRVMLGLPPGGFTLPTTVLAASRLERIALADVTQDGQLDLVASAYDDDALLVAAGHGDGGFDAPTTYATDDKPGALLVDDVDDDGRLDVLVGTYDLDFASEMSLFRGQPGGSLALAAILPTAGGMSVFRLADVDGDGPRDLLMVNGSQTVALLNTHGPWKNLNRSLAGGTGFSKLVGEGSLQPGSALSLGIVHAPPLTPLFLVLGMSPLNAPFKGGTLVPQPQDIKPIGATNGEGELQLSTTWPPEPAPGTTFFAQVWFADPGGPAGFASTNGIRGTSP